MPIILHALPPSANSACVRTFLAASDLEFEEQNCYGKTRSEEYIAKFPTNLAPAIEDGQVYVSETLAIMRYLAKVYPDKAGKFIPSDAAQAAKVDMLADYSTTVYSLISKAMYPTVQFPLYAGDVASMESTKAQTQASQEAAAAQLLQIYNDKYADIFLKSTKFLMSDELTIADFRTAPLLLFAKVAVALPPRLEQYLKDVEESALGWTKAVENVVGFASSHWK